MGERAAPPRVQLVPSENLAVLSYPTVDDPYSILREGKAGASGFLDSAELGGAGAEQPWAGLLMRYDGGVRVRRSPVRLLARSVGTVGDLRDRMGAGLT
jgi:hypothetical protein